MTYVDGFVFTVPRKNFKKYKKMAADASKIWKKYGAVGYYECIGDDLHPKWIKLTFPKLTKLKPSENVWFSFIIYKSKTHRNNVNKRVMAYFNKKYPNHSHKDMPFDMKKMAYGGFKTIVEK